MRRSVGAPSPHGRALPPSRPRVAALRSRLAGRRSSPAEWRVDVVVSTSAPSPHGRPLPPLTTESPRAEVPHGSAVVRVPRRDVSTLWSAHQPPPHTDALPPSRPRAAAPRSRLARPSFESRGGTCRRCGRHTGPPPRQVIVWPALAGARTSWSWSVAPETIIVAPCSWCLWGLFTQRAGVPQRGRLRWRSHLPSTHRTQKEPRATRHACRPRCSLCASGALLSYSSEASSSFVSTTVRSTNSKMARSPLSPRRGFERRRMRQ